MIIVVVHETLRRNECFWIDPVLHGRRRTCTSKYMYGVEQLSVFHGSIKNFFQSGKLTADFKFKLIVIIIPAIIIAYAANYQTDHD